MKRILLLFTLIPVFCFSQNYQTIQPDIEFYFEPESSFVVPLVFDIENISGVINSLRALKMTLTDTVQNGIVYNNHSEIHDDNYSNYHDPFETNCVLPRLSWIGNDIYMNVDGYNIFLNRQNDSIFIKTQALQNESFVFYNFPDGSYYLATIISSDLISFFGISDSAKTIGLQLYDSNNQPVTSLLNEKEIIITKNYGFYKTLNFRDFPDFGEQTYQVLEHTLYGHENIDSSFRKMKWRDIYDFEVGDEYHSVIKHDHDIATWYQNKIRKVLNKEWLSEDSVKYNFRDEKWGWTGPGGPYGGEYYHDIDTIYGTYSNLDSVIKSMLPFEPNNEINAGYDFISYFVIETDDYNDRPSLTITSDGYIKEEQDSLHCRWVDEYFNASCNIYVKGLGSHHCYTDYNEYYFYDVVSYFRYFKKGEEEWGTPLIPPSVNIQVTKFPGFITLYPNPASEIINVSVGNQQKVKTINIYNQIGQIVVQKKSPNETIDVSMLQPGLYIVDVVTDHGIVRDKLVIE